MPRFNPQDFVSTWRGVTFDVKWTYPAPLWFFLDTIKHPMKRSHEKSYANVNEVPAILEMLYLGSASKENEEWIWRAK